VRNESKKKSEIWLHLAYRQSKIKQWRNSVLANDEIHAAKANKDEKSFEAKFS